MAQPSEIEKLERRYAENPKGRNFAPLADAYRKAGQLDQAIELCTSGLEHHPDYVSAHIVFGRCLIDQHKDDNAAVVFRKVLELDPENVIAFRVLAEIGTRSGRLDETVLWLTKLLAADPMNGDAAEALAVAKGKAAQAVQAAQAAKVTTPVAPAPPPVAAVVIPTVPEPAAIVLDPEPIQAADLPFEAQQGSTDGIEVYDGTMDFSSVANSTAKADGIEIQEEIVLQAQEIAVEGLASSQYEASGLFKLDAETDADADAGEEDLATVDLPLIMPDSEEEAAADPAPAVPRTSGAERRPSFPHEAPPPAAVMLSDDDGAADTAALSRAEPVLTETMAELFLKQGHQEEALRVYQALQAQRPGDPRLRAKVEALSGGEPEHWREAAAPPSGQSAQAFLRGVLASRPGAPAAPEPPMAPPRESAFGRAASDPNPPGKPTRAAADDLSLAEVFGDAPGASTGSAPAPRPEPPASGGAPLPSGAGGFSFDEFFSAGGAPNPGGSSSAPNSGPQASGSRSRPPLEEDGDLDQFQSWLKGLKS